MTKLGWGILTAILVAVGSFLSMLSFSSPSAQGGLRNRVAAVLPPVVRSPRRLVVPVLGMPRGAIRDSWGDARGGGARSHHGTDIMAAGGTPVVAAAAGKVEKLFASRDGGTTLYVRSLDRRWSYYYAHLAGYAPGMHEGLAVRAGDPLGFVGDTGNAGTGNTHLHFGLSRMRPGERWWGGKPVNPYPMLARAEAAR